MPAHNHTFLSLPLTAHFVARGTGGDPYTGRSGRQCWRARGDDPGKAEEEAGLNSFQGVASPRARCGRAELLAACKQTHHREKRLGKACLVLDSLSVLMPDNWGSHGRRVGSEGAQRAPAAPGSMPAGGKRSAAHSCRIARLSATLTPWRAGAAPADPLRLHQTRFCGGLPAPLAQMSMCQRTGRA